MKLLVHAEAAPLRLLHAAAALALRGHEVTWLPGAAAGVPPPPVNVARDGRALARTRADVVLGGPAPRGAALAGWRTGAHAMVLALDRAAVLRWSWIDRLAWHSLYAIGLLEPAGAEAMRIAPHGLEFERLALWSDAPPAATPDATDPDTEILERAAERALARHRSRAARPAAFLDRDGTLVVERGYLSDADNLELLPGVPLALQNLRAAGYALIVISNQSGVGRGLFPLARVYEAMARLRRLLRAHGVELDAIYFCPHRPDADCPCRKPRPGLLLRAAEDQQLDLARSFMIGDKLIDPETGRHAGARGVLLRSGYGRDEERRISEVEPAERPDGVFDDLASAAPWLVREAEQRGRA